MVALMCVWRAVLRERRTSGQSQCRQIGAWEAPKSGNAWHRVSHVGADASVAGSWLAKLSEHRIGAQQALSVYATPEQDLVRKPYLRHNFSASSSHLSLDRNRASFSGILHGLGPYLIKHIGAITQPKPIYVYAMLCS